MSGTSKRLASPGPKPGVEKECAKEKANIGSRLPILKLLEFVSPTDGQVRACGMVWKKGDYVKLVSPLSKKSGDALAHAQFMQAFGNSCGTPTGLERTLQWLDAACFAARETGDVTQACEDHPEWHIRCVDYIHSDDGLQQASDMLHTLVALQTHDA